MATPSLTEANTRDVLNFTAKVVAKAEVVPEFSVEPQVGKTNAFSTISFNNVQLQKIN